MAFKLIEATCTASVGAATASGKTQPALSRGKDRSPMGRSAAPRLEKALTALGIDHDVKVYPGAGHGFLNDPSAVPVVTFGSRRRPVPCQH